MGGCYVYDPGVGAEPRGPCYWRLSYKFGEAPTDIVIWNTGWYDGQR
jgi:hypothetical protein